MSEEYTAESSCRYDPDEAVLCKAAQILCSNETIVVSACLCGVACRYDGRSQEHRSLMRYKASHPVLLVCPEQAAGLPTPRIPCERKNGRVISALGEDYTHEFQSGALDTLQRMGHAQARLAILKSKSPSCGVHAIYDGRFSGTCIPGCGVTTELLQQQGYLVIDENDFDRIISRQRDKA